MFAIAHFQSRLRSHFHCQRGPVRLPIKHEERDGLAWGTGFRADIAERFELNMDKPVDFPDVCRSRQFYGKLQSDVHMFISRVTSSESRASIPKVCVRNRLQETLQKSHALNVLRRAFKSIIKNCNTQTLSTKSQCLSKEGISYGSNQESGLILSAVLCSFITCKLKFMHFSFNATNSTHAKLHDG